MAPEAIKVFKENQNHLVSHALQGSEEQLIDQINQALNEKKYQEAQAALDKLGNAETVGQELTAAFDKVAEILVNSGLAKIEIPYCIPSSTRESSLLTQGKNSLKELVRQKKKKNPLLILPGSREGSFSPYRDRETFVENCLAQAMRSTIAKERRNNQFSFNNSREIASLMLQPNLRRNPKALERAHRRYMDGRSAFTKKINLAAQKTGAQTLEELFGPILPLIKNPIWEAFYEEAIEGYGDLSPKDFTEKVLKRFFTSRATT